jgi:prolyl 4-hydroxylase
MGFCGAYDRCVFDDVALADRLWQRVGNAVPASMNGRTALGLNERFRLYRYTAGQQFDWHADMPFCRDSGEISLLTFIVYLSRCWRG